MVYNIRPFDFFCFLDNEFKIDQNYLVESHHELLLVVDQHRCKVQLLFKGHVTFSLGFDWLSTPL